VLKTAGEIGTAIQAENGIASAADALERHYSGSAGRTC
jgi:hypothetical protein